MRILKEIHELRDYVNKKRRENKRIGFVPTMGYLHEGHGSLIKASSAENDITVVSIYVNPTQFAPNEDLDSYPRDLDRDYKIAEECGADAIFLPTNDMMYPEGYSTYVQVEGITNNLCGASRPSHFQGVTTIVTKLFNIVQPDRAYFGQKDAQQSLVIKRMVNDLHIPVEIVICPIVREVDGLAMSSRNTYLTGEQREQATILNKALSIAVQHIHEGQRDASVLRNEMITLIATQSEAEIDYVSVVSEETLRDVHLLEGNILIALAVRFGTTRLIDNRRIEVR